MKGRVAPGMPVVIGPHIHGFANPDGSGEGNWSISDAAEQLLKFVDPDPETQANFRWRLDAALVAERRATVERIRAALPDALYECGFGVGRDCDPVMVDDLDRLWAILDAERDR